MDAINVVWIVNPLILWLFLVRLGSLDPFEAGLFFFVSVFLCFLFRLTFFLFLNQFFFCFGKLDVGLLAADSLHESVGLRSVLAAKPNGCTVLVEENGEWYACQC